MAPKTEVSVLELLKAVQRILKDPQKKHSSWATDVHLLPAKNVPLLKFIGVGGLQVDLSVRNEKHFGIATRRFMNLEMKRHEGTLRPLVLVLKQLLHDRSLHDSTTGGFSSTSIFMLVNCFLFDRLRLPSTSSKPSVGAHLLQFLKSFGALDYSASTITAKGLKSRTRSRCTSLLELSKREPLSAANSCVGGFFDCHGDDGTSQMLIIDPCDRTQNIARSMYRLTPVSFLR